MWAGKQCRCAAVDAGTSAELVSQKTGARALRAINPLYKGFSAVTTSDPHLNSPTKLHTREFGPALGGHGFARRYPVTLERCPPWPGAAISWAGLLLSLNSIADLYSFFHCFTAPVLDPTPLPPVFVSDRAGAAVAAAVEPSLAATPTTLADFLVSLATILAGVGWSYGRFLAHARSRSHRSACYCLLVLQVALACL
jgi:hypothetical protein